MKSTIMLIIILISVIYLGMGILLYFKQRTLLYPSTPSLKSNYQTIKLHNGGESINIFLLNEEYDNAIIYFGGNAESMASSCDYIAKQFPKHRVYLMDYRGYGDSSGEPTEDGIYSDALALYDMIKPSHKKISIGGRSLGSAVATYVASKREVYKLALITPFDSIVQVAQDMYPLYPISLLLKDKYNAKEHVKDIKAPTFVVIAQNDTLITKERTESLIEAFPPNQIVVETIEGRGHGDISSDERYYTLMQDFIGDR